MKSLAETSREIKRELVALGHKGISVQSDRGCTEQAIFIYVQSRDKNEISEIEKAVEKYKVISKDDYGCVLGGGNRFVFVQPGY